MKNAKFKLVTETRTMGFEGAVNGFLYELDNQGYSYSISYAINKEGEYCAFVTYGKSTE